MDVRIDRTCTGTRRRRLALEFSQDTQTPGFPCEAYGFERVTARFGSVRQFDPSQRSDDDIENIVDNGFSRHYCFCSTGSRAAEGPYVTRQELREVSAAAPRGRNTPRACDWYSGTRRSPFQSRYSA